MYKPFLRTAALLGAVSVALGAFAAHGLKQYLPSESISVFETGVRYQFYHVFALLTAGILYREGNAKLLIWSGRLFVIGILLFSGSLYALGFLPPAFKWIGAITPLGGLAFIAGWVLLFVALRRR
jgi:uncharacterized membrane protein YgdD (TMEM256/DUF423 family)